MLNCGWLILLEMTDSDRPEASSGSYVLPHSTGQFTAMFSQLLAEMKSINAGITALHNTEATLQTDEIDEEALLRDDSANDEVALEKINDEIESLDSRVDKIIGSCQTSDSAEILTTIARDFSHNDCSRFCVERNCKRCSKRRSSKNCFIFAARENG